MYSVEFLYFFILFFLIEQSSCQQCYSMTKPSIFNGSIDIFTKMNCTNEFIWDIVDFSSRNLRLFDSSHLLSIKAKSLILKSNSIENISDSSFDLISSNLIELDLENNQLTSISSKWFNSKFEYLTKLNLASNQIKSFIDLNHVHLPNLQQLNLSNNSIEYFPNDIHRWSSLITLDLSSNQLSSIPRYALSGLTNLTWLSLADNRNLSCLVQDSFKYVKSLAYLDLSRTNLYNLDACIFVQLVSLKILQIEYISMNCTSCWLLIARKNALQIHGQCYSNESQRDIRSLTTDHLEEACSKTSIDCSKDSCEPGRIEYEDKKLIDIKSSSLFKTSTILFILGMICLSLFIVFLLGFYRWKKKKQIFCCQFSLQRKTTTIAEATRRQREHHKQIINHNPAVIESVVTHGANMNVPSYPYQNDGYFNDETSKNKRKLYNPMFADSSTTDDTSFYSEHL